MTEPTDVTVAESAPVITAADVAAQTQMEETVSDMLKHGYVEVNEINGFKVGARVKHGGQRWSGAYANGTATIERIFHKLVSSWAQKYNRQDIELIVRRDGDELAYGYWADYHTELPDTHE